MKKYFLFWIFSIIGFTLTANEGIYPESPSYEIISSTKDSKIALTKAVFVFQIKGLDLERKPILIAYSIDNKERKIYLNEQKQLKITTNPGKHTFLFFKSYSNLVPKLSPYSSNFFKTIKLPELS